ncbi:outer membrane beta-barrel protein [Aliirhizobium smilacinae]|uniref:Outer membrane beta-barrel protein n=1 Tax=Aliirhizobium smilacinae TaxID=1395944 RepID=A0A5C4XJ64_9HYPH|nr:outer membrane beta-barrel protein [Rhizobium smilacinae]TNM62624.1 hypothetical protein FHP24_15415 [Rhizobium smilacinae]
MKNTLLTGTARRGRRTALGLVVAAVAMSGAGAVYAQSLFPSNTSPLPGLPDSQFGTAGTTSVTGGATTTTWPATSALDGTDQSASGLYDPMAAPAAQQPAPAENTTENEDLNQTAEQDLNQQFDQPLDPGTTPIDRPEWEEQQREAAEAPGVRLGTFVLRPSVNQSINTEITRDHGSKETRNYLATGIRGTLTSDWSRHALTITGQGVFERNFSGNQNDTDPNARLGADLRLDLADDTIAHITGNYSFEREDVADPNAIGDASEQAGVHQFEGEASIEREVGRIRGLAAIGASRDIYTDAKLSDGSVFSMKDRNRTGIDGRLRLGYELSPAIIPFAEIALGHTFYDNRRDSAGYQRSSDSYAPRTGIAFDFGEKLRGELAGGYERVAYDDARLKAIDAFSADGNVSWSPRRGTDINLGLRTTVQDSTTAGQGGWAEYQLSSALAHQMRDHLVARLTGSATLRDFQGSADNNVTWIAGAGLTWSINRYLDMTGDIEYETTTGGGSDQDILRAGVGLTLRR